MVVRVRGAERGSVRVRAPPKLRAIPVFRPRRGAEQPACRHPVHRRPRARGQPRPATRRTVPVGAGGRNRDICRSGCHLYRSYAAGAGRKPAPAVGIRHPRRRPVRPGRLGGGYGSRYAPSRVDGGGNRAGPGLPRRHGVSDGGPGRPFRARLR